MNPLTIFPNPARAGSLVTVSFRNPNYMPDLVEIISSSGIVVSSVRQNISDESTVFNLHIPSALSRGVYFIRMMKTESKIIMTEKIIVQ